MDALIAKLKERFKDGTKLVIHECSMCWYPCGYSWFFGNQWGYDTGCYCTALSGGFQPRPEESLREFLSMNPEWIKRTLPDLVDFPPLSESGRPSRPGSLKSKTPRGL